MIPLSGYHNILLLFFLFLYGCWSSERPVSPELIKINVKPTYLMGGEAIGDVLNLSAIGYYSDNSTLDITEAVLWLSSDVRILTVDDSGIATILKHGKVNVYALHGGVYSNTLEMNIAPK
ncbi:hypothetical protein [Aeromonas veronii]|uniref:hypothetical protein n=1 Tax=Aeromonas veronii TaxID=654 RepID=UPI001117FB42|nr:hypothetical protein [Aeromonas veronii]TNI12505.1 hypothetical protein CF106_11055 [Aeromonas veronii]